MLIGEVGDIEHPTPQLPDLVPDVTEVYVEYESITFDPQTARWRFGTPVVNFDTHARNEGAVPLDIQADNLTSVTGSSVSQCVAWTTDFWCRQRQPVGGLTWHDDHKHYHFGDFATYELRQLLPDGQPDMSEAGLMATSPKVSVCLIDSVSFRDDARPVGRYHTCNPAEEGISPGWADVYVAGIDGQMLPVAGLQDGRYALVITMNPAGRLFETRSDNNVVVVTVEVTGLYGFNTQAGIVDKWHSNTPNR